MDEAKKITTDDFISSDERVRVAYLVSKAGEDAFGAINQCSNMIRKLDAENRELNEKYKVLVDAGKEAKTQMSEDAFSMCQLCKRLNPHHAVCESCGEQETRKDVIAKLELLTKD